MSMDSMLPAYPFLAGEDEHGNLINQKERHEWSDLGLDRLWLVLTFLEDSWELAVTGEAQGFRNNPWSIMQQHLHDVSGTLEWWARP